MFLLYILCFHAYEYLLSSNSFLINTGRDVKPAVFMTLLFVYFVSQKPSSIIIIPLSFKVITKGTIGQSIHISFDDESF